jgi:hypothetical protein
MTKAQQLRTLKKLADAHLMAVRARYANLSNQEDRLCENLAQLAKDKNRTGNRDHKDDPALVAGVDVLWHKWVDQRRGVINIELARVRAAKSECQRHLRQAFGKDHALGSLCERMAKRASR